jgi:copper chaperone
MMDKTHLKIEGMTCQHCVSHVTEALEGVAGVASAKVNLKKGEAVVKSETHRLNS